MDARLEIASGLCVEQDLDPEVWAAFLTPEIIDGTSELPGSGIAGAVAACPHRLDELAHAIADGVGVDLEAADAYVMRLDQMAREGNGEAVYSADDVGELDEVQRLTEAWREAEAQCRSSGVTDQAACDSWADLEDELTALGWCFGSESNQAAAEYDWHPCRPDSFRR